MRWDWNEKRGCCVCSQTKCMHASCKPSHMQDFYANGAPLFQENSHCDTGAFGPNYAIKRSRCLFIRKERAVRIPLPLPGWILVLVKRLP